MHRRLLHESTSYTGTNRFTTSIAYLISQFRDRGFLLFFDLNLGVRLEMIDSGLPIAVVETEQRDFGFLEHGAGLTSVGWIVFSFVAAFEKKTERGIEG